MTAKLELTLASKPHPYAYEASAVQEAWGQIRLAYRDSDTEVVLLDTQWDVLAFVAWYSEGWATWCEDTPPEHTPADSLAETLARLTGREFEDPSEEAAWDDQLYTFRQHHALRFALRGASIPDIIIGCNNAVGEISLAGQFAHLFDLADFQHQATYECVKFLANWMQSVHDPQQQQRGAAFINALNAAYVLQT